MKTQNNHNILKKKKKNKTGCLPSIPPAEENTHPARGWLEATSHLLWATKPVLPTSIWDSSICRPSPRMPIGSDEALTATRLFFLILFSSLPHRSMLCKNFPINLLYTTGDLGV